jgi:cytoskeletal protein RodZ
MSQQDSAAVQVEMPQAAVGNSLGSSLRDSRVARGMSLEDVSARLKYSVRQIQALEDERWDQLPSGVSLRGMIRNYARLVETDLTPFAETLSGHSSVSVRSPARELSSSDLIGDLNGARSSSSMPWGWLLVILVVVAAVVAYAFWQGWLSNELLSLDGIKQRFHR